MRWISMTGGKIQRRWLSAVHHMATVVSAVAVSRTGSCRAKDISPRSTLTSCGSLDPGVVQEVSDPCCFPAEAPLSGIVFVSTEAKHPKAATILANALSRLKDRTLALPLDRQRDAQH